MSTGKKTTLHTLKAHKVSGEKFAMVAAYDATCAALIEEAGVEVILVGDSLGMVLQGNDSTLPVSVADIAYHTRCVSRGASRALIIGDMPFGSYSTREQTLANAVTLMQAGAHMVKLEGGHWLLDSIEAMCERGIPVCAHLGLTPQSVHAFGGFKVQGRNADAAQAILAEAKQVEAAGASLLVLECIPRALAASITAALSIPVIGIGAGADTDAQVLVLHDMLGMSPSPPRFVRNFLIENSDIQGALAAFNRAVKDRSFPAQEHGFD
ncbi:MAG: 3-methyl-2-oxobutanoate hydroxymethyltransferase [Paraglaciecola psychrophila]|jgi:3-methyl-2-oxobutanoate hydroxymethyltransferase